MKDEYRRRRAAKHTEKAARQPVYLTVGTREIKLSPEDSELFRKVMRTEELVFREKFGREMGPDDPIFFEHDADTPQPMSAESYTQRLAEACEAAGIAPRLAYAVKKTGLIMGEENRDRFSEEQRRAWDDAVAEYDKFQ